MKAVFLAFTIIILLICGYYFQQHALVIMTIINGLGWLGPVLFLLLYCLATVMFLPTMVLTLAGGAFFGLVNGTLLNILGATMGASCAFFISRYLAKDWLTAKSGVKINKLISGVEARGWRFVALLRLIPIIPFNLVNYGLGITQIKFKDYLVTTFIFLMPCEIIYTYCGYRGMDALIHPSPFYKYTTLMIIGGTCILLFFLKRLK
jgi:uncharacterized membrane protein YdjX (TVP38/TMEM64 family)